MSDMRDRFESGLPFPEYIETVDKNRELWHAVYKRVKLPDGVVEEARALPGTWHLLAL